MFRFNPKKEDNITDEALELQSYDQHNQFQPHDIPEVIVEQVEEEGEEVNEDECNELPHEVNNAVRDRQNELLKQLESLKIQFQKIVQERNQEVH